MFKYAMGCSKVPITRAEEFQWVQKKRLKRIKGNVDMASLLHELDGQ
jgi:hypothetical protein